MSKLTKNGLHRMFQAKKASEQLEQAKNKFAFKTFSEQYNGLHSAVKWGRGLFHLFSILTAFTFLYLLFDSFIKVQVISGCLSIAILVFWEYVKSTVLENSFISYYRGNASILLPIIATVMLAGSVYTSLQGAKEYYNQTSTLVSDFETTNKVKLDSIDSHYYTQIDVVKAEMAGFKKSVSWKGKINVYDKTIKASLKRFNNEIESLSKERETVVNEFSSASKKELKDVTGKAEFNLTTFIVLSGINEFLIVICAQFLVFYQYKLVRESEVFEPTETYELDNSAINQLVQMVQRTVPNQMLISNQVNQQKPIGFKAGTTAPKSSTETDVNSDFKPEPVDIITAIRSGVKDPRVLMKTYKLNVIQVNQYLKEYA